MPGGPARLLQPSRVGALYPTRLWADGLAARQPLGRVQRGILPLCRGSRGVPLIFCDLSRVGGWEEDAHVTATTPMSHDPRAGNSQRNVEEGFSLPRHSPLLALKGESRGGCSPSGGGFRGCPPEIPVFLPGRVGGNTPHSSSREGGAEGLPAAQCHISLTDRRPLCYHSPTTAPSRRPAAAARAVNQPEPPFSDSQEKNFPQTTSIKPLAAAPVPSADPWLAPPSWPRARGCRITPSQR